MIPDSESQVRAVLEAYVASVTVPPSAIELKRQAAILEDMVLDAPDEHPRWTREVDALSSGAVALRRLASLQEQTSEK